MPCKMHRKQIHHGLKVLLFSLCLTGAFGCSDLESDDENLETSDNSNKGDLGGDDAKEGNGQENYVDTDEGKGGKGGADVNSATADGGDGGGSGNLLGEAGAGNMPPGNAAAGGAGPLNAAPLNAAAGNLAAGAPPVNVAKASAPAAAAPPPAAPSDAPSAATAAATGPSSPTTGGRVRYVKDGGVQAVSAPNGSPVATLEQGEHPITWEENGWLKITTGMYVPADGMSNTGVPRPQTGGGWAH